MKLCVILLMVALLASLCAAEPADSSAPRQPSGVLRFKRSSIAAVCPKGSIRIGATCMPEVSVPGQPSGGHTSGVQRFKRFAYDTGRCPPGYTNHQGFCFPEFDDTDDDYE